MQQTERTDGYSCPYIDSDKPSLVFSKVLESMHWWYCCIFNCMLRYFVLKNIFISLSLVFLFKFFISFILSLIFTCAFWKSMSLPRGMETSLGHALWSFKNYGRWTCQHVACSLNCYATWMILLPTGSSQLKREKKTKKGITLWGVNPYFNWGLFVLIQVNFVGVNPSLYAEFLYS